MPDASTQTKRVVISEVADHDFEGFVIVSREGESGPTPTIGDRLLEADRCGNAVAGFLEGYSTHLPKPKRWGTFRCQFWVVCSPDSEVGIYRSWAEAAPLVQEKRGVWKRRAICIGWSTLREAEHFLESFLNSRA